MLKQVQHDGLKGRKANSRRQIMPIWILALDEIDFPLAMPAFELLLACDGRRHVIKLLKSDKMVDTVALGEAFDRPRPMLPKTRNQIGRDSDVERAIGAAGEDVDARLFH
jgi:hypothetical protein